MPHFVDLAVEVLAGKYADAVSAALGLLGAFAFAKAPMESLRSRRAIFQILTLVDAFDKETVDKTRAALVVEAKVLLDVEKRWNLLGAALLALSFAVLIAHAIHDLYFPAA